MLTIVLATALTMVPAPGIPVRQRCAQIFSEPKAGSASNDMHGDYDPAGPTRSANHAAFIGDPKAGSASNDMHGDYDPADPKRFEDLSCNPSPEGACDSGCHC